MIFVLIKEVQNFSFPCSLKNGNPDLCLWDMVIKDPQLDWDVILCKNEFKVFS